MGKRQASEAVPKGKAKAAKAPPSEPETELLKDRKAMLGYLKYAPNLVNATAKHKDECQKGLEVYSKLPQSKKGAFIERWKRTKDSKQLGWMRDFEEEMSKEREFTRGKLEGLYTRHPCKQVHLHARAS